MTSHQKELVRKTFAMVEHHGASVAAQFYKELFRLDPTIRPELRPDLEEQGKRLMQAERLFVRGSWTAIRIWCMPETGCMNSK